MNSQTLLKLIKSDPSIKNHFSGLYSVSDFNKMKWEYNQSYVIFAKNHYLCLVKGLYRDSLGKSPAYYGLKNVEGSCPKFQSSSSCVCALYVLFFLGINSEKIFTFDQKLNDAFILDWFSKRYSIEPCSISCNQ